jgi:hypothetical protein
MVSHIAIFSWKNRPTPVGQFSKISASEGPSKLGGGLLYHKENNHDQFEHLDMIFLPFLYLLEVVNDYPLYSIVLF